MQTSSPIQAVPSASSAPVAGVGESLLDRFVPGLSGQVSIACHAEADLVPYRVRQALNQALDSATTERLVAQLLSMPHSVQTYTRHIVHADPKGMFTVVALRWDPTQGSPVHAHYTWCAYRILHGQLTESHFEWDRSAGQAYLFNRISRAAGQSVCGHGGMDFIHRLSNETAHTALSLHIYGIDGGRVGTHVNRMVALSHEIN